MVREEGVDVMKEDAGGNTGRVSVTGVVVGAGSYGKRCATVQIVDAFRQGGGAAGQQIAVERALGWKCLSLIVLRQLREARSAEKPCSGAS